MRGRRAKVTLEGMSARVLDLGSGGGRDMLLSARWAEPGRFAQRGRMTDGTRRLARANAAETGAEDR